MNSGVIAQRYATALLRYANETRNEDLVYSQVITLVQAFQDVPQFRGALEHNPELSFQDRLALMRTALGEEHCEELYRFVQLVDSHSRMEFFSRMLIVFIDKYRESKNIKVGTLVTAIPQEGLKTRLEALVGADTGSTVNLSTKVDDAVIGGFVLQIGDLRMDASVAGQFKRIKDALVENDNRII